MELRRYRMTGSVLAIVERLSQPSWQLDNLVNSIRPCPTALFSITETGPAKQLGQLFYTKNLSQNHVAKFEAASNSSVATIAN